MLFGTLRKLSANGVAILYISHKLDEILALCDHATILRMGKVVDTCPPKEETAKSLAEMMIGGELDIHTETEFASGPDALVVNGLALAATDAFGTSLKNIAFKLTINFPAGYGFTAIIVAFLGRLNPVGVLLAGVVLAGTYIGGENAQFILKLPAAAVTVFQGLMLFFLLGFEILINYRVKRVRRAV